MKTLLFMLATITTFGCYAQKETPAAVQEAFKKNFPGVTVKKWEKEDGNYEANFTKDGKSMSATFDVKGTWMETETDIAAKDLPASVRSYVKEYYKGSIIKEAAMLKTPKGDMYEAEVKGKDLLFDMSGKFLIEKKD
ncbi:hypothetical protein FRZ67_01595 [Panacibacter ginsenosidivorans]|uniref:Putative beta-lactamase-inhibitor-like PepSY-like domain-containing protein n=1 Tax=Panacibacter ginsenosidivorans TaxID=1813871 RepID=A0A5B8V5P8_9BACT|nr:PepSY-like domain-containing protein [Panacibacter ginsenosidivorans]QEC66061.1 hypothetical protein FRZ67_01595 [Panacibacter ginsenosidivorans]